MRRVEDTAIAFARACIDAGVEYAVIRAIAVLAWGQPRATSDVDALIIMSLGQVDPFVAALASQGLEASVADLQDALVDKSHVTIFDPQTNFHVDARTTRDAAEEAQVRSATVIELHGQPIRIARAEETVAFKLKFGSPQDLQDARSILIRQEKLDMPRLRALAAKLGVEKNLDDLIAL